MLCLRYVRIHTHTEAERMQNMYQRIHTLPQAFPAVAKHLKQHYKQAVACLEVERARERWGRETNGDRGERGGERERETERASRERERERNGAICTCLMKVRITNSMRDRAKIWINISQ